MIRKLFDPTKSFLFILIVLAFSGVGGSFYFHAKYRDIKADPYLEVKKETALAVASVGKLIELPANETPVVAAISDKEKLRNQIFFQMAENGDILLAYNVAMKAILYRPSTNKIINVAPISPNKTDEGVTPIASSTGTSGH